MATAAAARGSEPFGDGHLAPLVATWAGGRPLEVIARRNALGDRVAVPTRRFRLQWALLTAMVDAFAGRSVALDRLPVVPAGDGLSSTVLGVMARVAGHVSAGDEASAAGALDALLADDQLDDQLTERQLRRYLALVYVLVPGARPAWDSAALGPSHARARQLASALVAARDGADVSLAAVSVDAVLTDLPLRWAVELATASGARSLLGELLDRCGETARGMLRDLADHPVPAVAAAAARHLGELPATPDQTIEIRVLGPTTLLRDGAEVDEPDWRRERVRSLLALLVHRQEVTRLSAMTTLWPDLTEEAAGRNLRVNLAYLQRVLEPDRGRGEAPYFVRHDGDMLRLAGADRLVVDVWQLEMLLDDADAADRRGDPAATVAALRRPDVRGRRATGALRLDRPGVPSNRRRARRLRPAAVAGA